MASSCDYMQDRMASQMSRYYQKSEGGLPGWLPSAIDQQSKIMSQLQSASDSARNSWGMPDPYHNIYNRREVIKFVDPEIQIYYNGLSEQTRTMLHQNATRHYLPGTSGWANDIKNQIEKYMQERQLEQVRGQMMKTPAFKWIDDMENDRKRNDKTELNDELFKVKSFKLNQNN